MQIRDRVRELRRVRAGELRPHPRNWRTHPLEQQDALRGVLAEIGYADALIARELEDGSLELIDGHLRADTTPNVEVPVLIVDLSAAEADKLLVVHDPLAGMAGTNSQLLSELLAEVETQNDAVRAMLETLTASTGASSMVEPPVIELKPVFQVVVECADESEQQAVFERLRGEGYSCRVLTL